MTWESNPAAKQSVLIIDGIPVTVSRKRVKYIRIKVKPPEGDVHVSAPHGTLDRTIAFAVRERLLWIRKHQVRITSWPRIQPLALVTGEQVPYQGRLYDLRVVEAAGRPSVAVHDDGRMVLRVKSGSDRQVRGKLLDKWYRERLAETVPPMLAHWQQVMGVTVNEWRIRKMKSRWGSCNTKARRVWINLELVKRPPALLEFIVVHEMAHLIEPSHNANFKRLMTKYMPDWREREAQLKKMEL